MRETDPKQGREDEGVIGDNATNAWGKHRTVTKLLEAVDRAEVTYRNDDGEVATVKPGFLEQIY